MDLFQHPLTPLISLLLALKRSAVPQSLLLHSMELPRLENCVLLRSAGSFLYKLLDSSSLYRKGIFHLITMPPSWHCLTTSEKPVREYCSCSLERHSAEKWYYLSVLPPKCHLLSCRGWWHSQELTQTLVFQQLEFQRTDISSSEGRCQAAVTQRKTQGSE